MNRLAVIILPAALIAFTSIAPAQSTIDSTGGAGAITGGGAGMIGGPSASAGTSGTGVVALPSNQPHNLAPAPAVGAGYGTPGNVGNLGNASNSGAGAGVQSDITTGIQTSPNTR